MNINLRHIVFQLKDYLTIVSAVLLTTIVILVGFFRVNVQVVKNVEVVHVSTTQQDRPSTTAVLGLSNSGLTKGIDASQSSPNKIDYKTISKNRDPNFKLIIPKIGLEKKVYENIDPGLEKVYKPVLEKGIAHGKFTKLPDEATTQGNIYLFAHRNGHVKGQDIGFFRRIGELERGDEAIISYLGQRYIYKFKGRFVITPGDTWVYNARADQPTLTLQTCEDNETKRLIVKFTLVKVEK